MVLPDPDMELLGLDMRIMVGWGATFMGEMLDLAI